MPNTDAMLDALQRIAADPAQRVYVLVDGARFDDLPGMLSAAGLSHRSLYRNVQDAELVRAGPWLVDPYRLPDPAMNAWGGLPLDDRGAVTGEDAVAADTDAALRETALGRDDSTGQPPASGSADPVKQLDLIAGIAADLPAAVFWIGDASFTEPKLWQHLRTLNMVLIPKEYDAPEAPLPAEGEETHDALVFRHGDGNVLAEVLPVLDAAQFSRVFGPAKALMFLAPDHPASDGSSIRRAVLPEDAPPAPAGMLKLSMDQMGGIEAARFERLNRRTTEYLLRVGGDRLDGRSEATLRRDADTWLKSGMAYGVKSECALWQWSYLQLYTKGGLTQAPGMDAYMRRYPGSADDKVEHLMSSTITRLKELA